VLRDCHLADRCANWPCLIMLCFSVRLLPLIKEHVLRSEYAVALYTVSQHTDMAPNMSYHVTLLPSGLGSDLNFLVGQTLGGGTGILQF